MDAKALKTLAIVSLVIQSGLALQKETSLPKKYETWLKEEAVYIITDKEKDVFFKLETDRDRDLFIEEFWRQRDPTPGTPKNELRDEHYRRIEFANKTFGRGTPFKGWRTDQGRIFIMLGMPFDVQKIMSGDVYPIEIWYYHGNPAFGQAPIFRLLFFQKGGGGEFKLYSPVANGPKDLVPNPFRRTEGEYLGAKYVNFPEGWDDMDRQAYKLLHDNVSPEVAETTISLIPGSQDRSQILRSQILFGEIEKYPQKKVNNAYAYNFLEHKASVEVSYSVHFMGNRSAVSLLQDPSGLFFLNYVIVPENLSLDTFQDKYFADLKTTLRLADAGGKTVFQEEKYIPIELRKEELRAVEKNSFHLYDAFPLIPGVYTFSLLVENTVSKEFTSIEKTVSIPEGNPLWMSPLILARKVAKDSISQGTSRAFQVGQLQIYPCLNSTFQTKDRLFLFFQIFGMSRELKDQGILEYSLFNDEQVLQSSRKNVRDFENGRDFLEEFSLDKVIPGTYAMKAALFDKGGREVLSQGIQFLVSDKAIPGSWIVAQANPPAEDPYYSYVLGCQYLSRGDVGKARGELAAAYERKPGSLDYAVGYARILVATKEPGRARDILLPFAKKEVANFDLYDCLGKAFQEAGDIKEAIPWYQKALSHKGNVIEVLNSLGECYFKIGDKEQALRAWKKSLEINPNQENIKKMIERLKE
jgi:GWxTD domain-containing protein